jgi:hypothetical protein
MARIELRDATIYIKDGLSGTVNVAEATPAANDTDMDVNTVALNTSTTDLIPVGGRFTFTNSTTVFTVTARTPASAGPTTNITFTPALDANVPAQNDTLTFEAQQIEVKIGDGNLTYTENKEYDYLLDRGDLDTVREGDAQPVDVSLDFVYEFVRTGTNETITPPDAVKGIYGADEWVSAAADLCEPYAVDVVIEHDPPCGTAETETTTLPDFRYESLEYDLQAASIAVSGRCNVTLATITRT